MAVFTRPVRPLYALGLAGSLWLAGCAPDHVQRGTNLYGKGRYVEAAEVFERTEHRLPNMEAQERARYGLYRGLTLLVLGDLAGSQHWFAYASQIETTHPGALGPERQALLARGNFELQGRMQAPSPVAAPQNALAESPQPGVVAPQAAPAGDQLEAVPPAERRSLVP